MSFNERTILAVWEKGTVEPGYGPETWRQDQFGNVIRFEHYGNRNSVAGWEIDHIVRVSDGGTDSLVNLRPIHWKANVRRG